MLNVAFVINVTNSTTVFGGLYETLTVRNRGPKGSL